MLKEIKIISLKDSKPLSDQEYLKKIYEHCDDLTNRILDLKFRDSKEWVKAQMLVDWLWDEILCMNHLAKNHMEDEHNA